jgi:hypothetical protein
LTNDSRNHELNLQRLQAMLAGEDKNIPLAEAALMIAHHLAPDTDVALYLKKLQGMQADLAKTLTRDADTQKKWNTKVTSWIITIRGTVFSPP